MHATRYRVLSHSAIAMSARRPGVHLSVESTADILRQIQKLLDAERRHHEKAQTGLETEISLLTGQVAALRAELAALSSSVHSAGSSSSSVDQTGVAAQRDKFDTDEFKIIPSALNLPDVQTVQTTGGVQLYIFSSKLALRLLNGGERLPDTVGWGVYLYKFARVNGKGVLAATRAHASLQLGLSPPRAGCGALAVTDVDWKANRTDSHSGVRLAFKRLTEGPEAKRAKQTLNELGRQTRRIITSYTK